MISRVITFVERGSVVVNDIGYPFFQNYGFSHQVMLVVFVAVSIGLVVFGKRYRGTPFLNVTSRIMGGLILIAMLLSEIFYILPQNFGLQHSLPLQLCDLAWLAAGLALLTRSFWSQSFLYYWGLTLSIQGIFTPNVQFAFPHPVFFLFWICHLLIVWAAIYNTWGLGFRPNWRSFRLTFSFTIGWVAFIFILNRAIGTNYMFINRKPDAETILDLMGPWPQYLLVEFLIIATTWILITLPWVRGKKAEKLPINTIPARST